MSNYFHFLLAVLIDLLAVIFLYDKFGYDDYSYAAVALTSLLGGITILWVGLARFQKHSPKCIINGSNDAWSFSGKYYQFKAHNQDWVIVRVGKGFGAGNKKVLPREGVDSICMKAERVRFAAWPHIFSVAWYKPQSAKWTKQNYPVLYEQICKKMGRNDGVFWFEYRYDPKDELNFRKDRHPDTNEVLKADDIKADLKIGSESIHSIGERNSLIAEFVDREHVLKQRTEAVIRQSADVEKNIINTVSNVDLVTGDLKRAKRG